MRIVIVCPYCHKKVGVYGARNSSCPHCKFQVGLSEWEIAIEDENLSIPLSLLDLDSSARIQLLRDIFMKLPYPKGETPTVFVGINNRY